MLEILIALCLVANTACTGLLTHRAILEKKRRRNGVARSLPYGL